MKTTSTWLAGLLICCTALFSRCAPDYQYMLPTEELLTRNGWQVEQFNQSGTDLTGEFYDYQLFFNADRSFTIRHGNTVVNGTWQYTNSNNVETVSVRIDASNTRILLLNENWVLKAKTPYSVQLEETNGTDINQLRIRAY